MKSESPQEYSPLSCVIPPFPPSILLPSFLLSFLSLYPFHLLPLLPSPSILSLFSGADVYDRVSTYLESLWRDIEKGRCGENTIIVSHGLFCRLFLMRYYHWTVSAHVLYACMCACS